MKPIIYCLGVRLKISTASSPFSAYPSGNSIGLELLGRVIKNAFKSQKIEYGKGVAFGELNDGWLVFETESRLKGLEIIREELLRFRFGEVCEIAWFDVAEEIWRSYLPSGPSRKTAEWFELPGGEEFFAKIMRLFEPE